MNLWPEGMTAIGGITTEDLMTEGKSLISEDGENREYDRAICELIASFVSNPDEGLANTASVVSDKIGAGDIYGEDV